MFDDVDEMSQRCAYVDTQILFMSWDSQKDGWVPALSTMSQHREGQLRVYEPSDNIGYLVTMPGHIRWETKFDGDDIREVLEFPWVPVALQGMREDEIDELDAYRLSTTPILHVEVAEPLTFDERLAATILASLSVQPKQRPAQKPQPLPKHIRTIVLERAESDGQTCPITLTAIRSATASVTSCGHIFQTAAIQEWLSENETCPECRGVCSV
jgi:hypothetical protein